MSDRGEPIRWITINGAHVPIYADNQVKSNDKGEPVRWITVKGTQIPVYSDGSIGMGIIPSQSQLKADYESVKIPWDMTPEERYRLAEKYTKDVANKDNFYENSVGFWDLKSAPPKREPDHESKYYKKGTGELKTSSKYWYTDKGVYRQSDHWGSEVASCAWYIKGRKYASDGVSKGKKETAFISWNDLKAQGGVGKRYDTGEYFLTGFEFKK